MQTVPAKTIVSDYSECGWFGANYNMNIYRGCCHGCIYCDSRSECYHIENFDTVRAKENALETIERDLRSKRRKGLILTGSMSDPYNPFEKDAELTRGALHLIDRYGFGVLIGTKSDLVVRDRDLLRSVREHSPAVVNFTITTADDDLCRKIEQNVCPTSSRLNAIRELTDGGISCGVILTPVLPFINDTEENILQIVEMAAQSGAKWIYTWNNHFSVTLRQNQRDYFYEKLDLHFPGVKEWYIRQYGNSYECQSPDPNLYTSFAQACERHGILYRMEDIIPRIRSEYRDRQISLFN